MSMSENPNPERNTPRREFVEATHASVVIAGMILAIGGWSGLIWLVFNVYPTVPNRWAFYSLLQIALSGTALPFVRFLNTRFGKWNGLYVTPGVLVRQATWVGLFGTACAWLRIPRLLSPAMVILLVIALVMIEFLLRLRDRMQVETF